MVIMLNMTNVNNTLSKEGSTAQKQTFNDLFGLNGKTEISGGTSYRPVDNQRTTLKNNESKENNEYLYDIFELTINILSLWVFHS